MNSIAEKRAKFLGASSVEIAKVNMWLDKIGETDEACRAEVIGLCEKGGEIRHKDGTIEKLTAKSYRDFYLSMAAASC